MRPKMNILFFCTDQLRQDALGCMGNTAIYTPNLDRVAEKGVKFTQHSTPCPICSPSRASMLTGLYPRHHGLTRNGIALSSALPTLPGALQQNGYRTHAVGKLHLQPLMAPASKSMPESMVFWQNGTPKDWIGPYYGFETVNLVLGEAHESANAGHYAAWLRERHPEVVPLYQREASKHSVRNDLWEVWKCAVPEELHYNSWIADQAVRFIRDCDSSQPFFLKVSFPDPHHPFSPPHPYCDRYDPRQVPRPRIVPGELDHMPDYVRSPYDPGMPASQYGIAEPETEQGVMIQTNGFSEQTMGEVIAYTYGMVEMIDTCIGRVLNELKRQNLSDNTLIVFTSDHGELLGDHGLLRKGPPPYRQLLMVPLIMCGPGIPQNRSIGALTSHLDLFPTLAELTGCPIPDVDGKSLHPILRGETAKVRDVIFAEYHPRLWPEVYNHTIITDKHRLTIYPLREQWGEFFDRNQDTYEHHNLFGSAAQKELITRLAARMTCDFKPQPDAGDEVLGNY